MTDIKPGDYIMVKVAVLEVGVELVKVCSLLTGCVSTIFVDRDDIGQNHSTQTREEYASTVNADQVGGSHYKHAKIQPWDYIDANGIPFLEGSTIKYISRWREKDGIQDLKKAIHFIQKRIELEESKL